VPRRRSCTWRIIWIRSWHPPCAKDAGSFLAQFPSLSTDVVQGTLADPGDRETFERCKFDHAERAQHPEATALHRDLLMLRRQDPVFSAQRIGGLEGAVLGDQAFVLRFFGPDGDDRLMVVNLGSDQRLVAAAEPLLAPPSEGAWRVLWSSEDVRYGGSGTPPLDPAKGWLLLGQAAVAFAPDGDSG
jgi:maltooligosyltrehalose trehalohydrolase